VLGREVSKHTKCPGTSPSQGPQYQWGYSASRGCSTFPDKSLPLPDLSRKIEGPVLAGYSGADIIKYQKCTIKPIL